MKKLSFLSMALIAGTTVSAQSNLNADTEVSTLSKAEKLGVVTRVNRTADRGPAFFYEDFSNGLTGNNGVGAWTTSGPDADLWLYDTDGPNGDFSDTSEVIDSETVGNGFMIFDANLSNPGAAIPGTIITDRNGSLISPVMDFTGKPGVNVSFTQAYRYCCSSAHELNLEVSIDGGATFPNVFQINGGVGANEDTRGVYSVNITTIAGNQSSVVIKFTWGAGTASHYHWQLDDITIDAPPANDLEMRDVWTDDFFHNPIYEVLQVPANMASARTFVAIVKNNGATAKDVYVEAVISTTSGDVTISSISSPVNLDPNESDSVYIDFAPSVWEVSNYSIAMTALATGVDISEDFTPANNTKTAQFDVTNNTLASFPRTYTGSSLSGNYIDVDDDGNRDIIPVVYLNQYLFFENATAHAIGTAFADASVAQTEIGAQVTWQIYEEVDGDIDLNSPLVSGSNLEIVNGNPENLGLTTDMVNTRRTILPFNTLGDDGNGGFAVVPDPLDLTGDVLGKSYAVAVTLPSDAIVFMRVNADDNDDASTLAYGDLGSAGVDFYRNFSHCIIELYLHENALSVAEQANRPDFYLAQNRPNPFNGGTTITYQLNKKANNISFEVFDVTGKQVMNINEGSKGAGQYNIMLDGSEFTTGLYYYSLTVNGQKLTRKMVITE